MVWNHKVTGTAKPMALGLVIGAGTALLILVITAMAIAWLVLGERMPVSAIGYGVMVAHLMAVSVGGIVGSTAIKHRKMLVCMIVGCLYYLCLIVCTAVFFGGQYQGMGVTALVIAGASGLTGFIMLRCDNDGKRRYRKYRNR